MKNFKHHIRTICSQKFLLFLVCAFTILLFWRVQNGEFLGWDDDRNILANPYFFSKDAWAFWRHSFEGLYAPVIYTVWDWLYRGSDTSPVVYHSFNLILHLCNIILVYFLFRKFSPKRSPYIALVGTTIFALHPFQIETVAWITGGRDLLALFFALLATHMDFSKIRWKRVGLAPLFFGLGLLCKPAIIAIPIFLCLFKIYQNPGFYKKAVIEYIPWFCLALPILWLTYQTQESYGNYNVIWTQRPLVVLSSAGFYIQNFFLPLKMKADYGNTPTWIVENLSTIWIRFVWIGVALASLFIRRFREFGLAVLAFLILFSPISGIASFTFQQISNIADRYMYLPILPLAWGFANQMDNTGLFWTGKKAIASFLIISLGFLFISFPRVSVWKTNELFFETMVRDNSQSYSAHLNLASMDQKRGDLSGAIEHVNKAALYAPNNLNVTLSAYILLSHLGQHQKVLTYYNELPESAREKYRTSDPLSWANFLTNVSVSQFALGQVSASLETTCEALHLDPQSDPAKKNLEILKTKLNRTCAADK